MRRARQDIALLVLGLLCGSALLTATAIAQTVIPVARVGPEVRPADPGGVVTIAFTIRNDSSAVLGIRSTGQVPEGWRLVTRPMPLSLAPGETGTHLISVAIPERAAAGVYSVRVAVLDSTFSAFGSDSARVEVGPRRSVSVRLMEVPRYVGAGGSYEARFLVSNDGNVVEQVDLSLETNAGYLAQLDAPVLTLEPYSSAVVTARVQTPGALTWKSYHTGALRARAAGGEAINVPFSLDVLPAVAERGDPFRRLPSEFSVRSIAQDGRIYPQVDLQGEGQAVFQEGDELEVLLRGPNLLRRSVLGEMDEYALRYRTEQYRVQLGDATYILSPLTEPGVRGFGAGAEGEFGRWRLGSYAQQTRYYFPAERQAGAYARYALLDRLTTGVNYLGKSGRFDGQLLTLLGEVRPGGEHQVTVEAGGDLSEREDNLGVSVDAYGRSDRYSYSGRFLKAGEGFNSNYRGVTFGSGSGRYNLSRAAALEASFFDQSRQGIRGILFSAPQRFAFYRAGGRFYNRAGVYYVLEQRDENGRMERQEQGVQLDFRQPAGIATLVGRLEAGRRRYRTLTDPFFYVQYDATAYLRLAERRSVYVSVGGDEDRNPFTGHPERRLSFSGGGNVSIGQGFRAGLSLNHSRSWSASAFAFTSADAQLSYSFRAGQRLVLRGRWFGFGRRDFGGDEAVSLQYIVPLRLPLGRARSSGIVEGRVYDLETGEGVENVQLSLGDAAVVTGDDGTFAFRGIAPAEYVLSVEGIGVDRIPAQPMPARVEVRGGGTATVEVGVGPAASLVGQVVRYGYVAEGVLAQQAGGELQPVGGQRGLIVEARSGSDVQRRLTDSQGRFVFSNLRPGAWTVSVVGGQVPENHRIEQDSLLTTLTAGREATVAVRLVPNRRNVQIVPGGELTLEPEAGEEPEPGEQPTPPPGSTRWTVRPAEVSLRDVARAAYGDGALWPKIWVANRQAVPDPDLIQAGHILVLPPPGPLTPEEEAALREYEAGRGRR